jgi:hypothetical protein
MRNFELIQELAQKRMEQKLVHLMGKSNCDTDEQMKNETKKVDTASPEEVSTPGTNRISKLNHRKSMHQLFPSHPSYS